MLSTYTRFLKRKRNHQVRKLIRTCDLNQQEFVQRNWVCEQQYLQLL